MLAPSSPTATWFDSLPVPSMERVRRIGMLQIDRLCVRIAGADVLRSASLHVRPNAFVALVGRNGAGKTTLMRSVMRLIPSWSGEIRIGDRAATHAKPSDHAANGVGYMPEDRRLIAD